MATQVQVRGAAQATQEARTLVSRELDVNTTDKRISVHDGSTAGGVRHVTSFDHVNQEFTYASASGTNTITMSLAVAPAAYQAGQKFCFKAAATNTGSATLNVNSLGAKTIKKIFDGAIATLDAGDIVIGGIYICVYDGTDMILLNINNTGSTDWTYVKTTLSGDTIDLATGIPATVTEIHGSLISFGKAFNAIDMYLQIGDSGGAETTGYTSYVSAINGAGVCYVDVNPTTAGFCLGSNNIISSSGASSTCEFSITKQKDDENLWIFTGDMFSPKTAPYKFELFGTKTLSDVLTQIRLTGSSSSGAYTGTAYLRYK